MKKYHLSTFLAFCLIITAGCTCTKGAMRCHNNVAQICSNSLEWQTVTDCSSVQDADGKPLLLSCQPMGDGTQTCLP